MADELDPPPFGGIQCARVGFAQMFSFLRRYRSTKAGSGLFNSDRVPLQQRTRNFASPNGMKFGVLTFSYANNKGTKSVAEDGFFSMNLGDYMQTLAVRRLYREFGISEENIVDIDRDTISSYAGPPVIVLMSAVFLPWSFPLPENIVPVFVGFQAAENVIRKNLDYFKRHAPIGCRDTDTADLFRRHGVDAFTTGCVTMSFEPRTNAPTGPKVLIVCGGGPGSFPAEALATMPAPLLKTAEFVFQRKIVHRCPLSTDDMINAEKYAAYLLSEYRERASLIVTSLHHATTPCISSGIPVVLCRTDNNTRFSFLRQLMNIYTPDRFNQIDWNPSIPHISEIRSSLINTARTSLEAAYNKAIVDNA